MSKQPKPGHCVHCLKWSDELTWDHVFPSSWYPDNTPSNLEKWKIPSCPDCNSAYGKLEQDLLLKLGMCVGPEEEKASGIALKTIRSLDPRKARDTKDQKARALKHQKLRRFMVPLDAVPADAILPGFGPPADPQKRATTGIKIAPENIERMGRKFVRGLTYIRTGQLIRENYEIGVDPNWDQQVEEFRELAEKYGETLDRGPGISVRRAAARDDPVSALFIIEIWGRLKIFAGVCPIDSVTSPHFSVI